MRMSDGDQRMNKGELWERNEDVSMPYVHYGYTTAVKGGAQGGESVWLFACLVWAQVLAKLDGAATIWDGLLFVVVIVPFRVVNIFFNCLYGFIRASTEVGSQAFFPGPCLYSYFEHMAFGKLEDEDIL